MKVGYQPMRCTCGHTSGAHRNVRTGSIEVIQGICLTPGCECRKFHDANAKKPA